MLIEDILFTHLLLRLKRAWWVGKDRKRKGMEAGDPGLSVYLSPPTPLRLYRELSLPHTVGWASLARCRILLQLTGGHRALSAWKLHPPVS